jgi:membrane-associated phospholipid phosphatase
LARAIKMGKKREEKKFKVDLSFDYHSSRFFSILFPVLYLIAIAIFCLVYHIIPGPEFLVLGILIYAGYDQRTWRVVKDWLPFITVFISYEVMYSIIGTIANNIKPEPYYFELHLFGGIPSLILQQTIRMPILDYMGAFFYSIYFFVPTIFAFVLWKKSPQNYWKYIVSFGVCTYAALVTFLFYPVRPPWMEMNSTYNLSYHGPEIIRILTASVDKNLGIPVYKTMFDFLSPNLYAAFPSMHSALPWLVFLFAFKVWKWKALPVAIIPVGTWFSAVYLGEHYVVDVFGGILYATVAFIAVEKLLPLLSGRIHFLKKHVPKEKIEP